MRKESRAMDSQWALEVMHKAPYMTVSFIDEDGKPYGLPLSLASDDDVNWYFHGALEGKKLEAIKAHPEVCLSAVTRCTPTVGPKDGSFTLQYKSAIAFGKAEIVTEDAEKIHGLRLISERFLPQHMDTSTRASPVPYHARLLFASRLLNRQPANASSMIRKAWR